MRGLLGLFSTLSDIVSHTLPRMMCGTSVHVPTQLTGS